MVPLNEERIAEINLGMSASEVTRRREEMMRDEVLPRTTFVIADDSTDYIICDDSFKLYQYIVYGFPSKELRDEFFNEVMMAHATKYPCSRVADGEELHQHNETVDMKYEDIVKELEFMRNSYTNDKKGDDSTVKRKWAGDRDTGGESDEVSKELHEVKTTINDVYVRISRHEKQGRDLLDVGMKINKLLNHKSTDPERTKRVLAMKSHWERTVDRWLGPKQSLDGTGLESNQEVLMTMETNRYVILDSGSTAHMMRDRELLTNIKKLDVNVVIGGVENGSTGIRCSDYGSFKSVDNVLLSEDSSANILSLSLLKDKGHTVSGTIVRKTHSVYNFVVKREYTFLIDPLIIKRSQDIMGAYSRK
jgi:hypothetical protein